ncbi:MAG: hypothetical protein ACT4OJ_10855 [Bacteroidota bacterium]
MAETEKREGIIGAIKSPLGITALIILVAEAITLTALLNTSKSDPFYKWYYVIMIGLLLTLVPAYYYYLHIMKWKFKNSQAVQSVDVEGKTMNALPAKDGGGKTAGKDDELFSDSNYGFEFIMPKGMKKSSYLNYKEYLDTISGTVTTDEEYEAVISKMDVTQFGELFLQSKNIIFQFGDTTSVYFTDDTTTDVMEIHLEKIVKKSKADGKELTEKEISELRYELNFRGAEVEQVNFTHSFTISIMPKKFAKGYGITPSITNVFLILLVSNPQPMDDLHANKDSILWKSTNKVHNLEIEGKIADLLTYKIDRIIEDDDNFFVLSVQWSPNLLSAYEVWNQLQKMFESFRLTKKKNGS